MRTNSERTMAPQRKIQAAISQVRDERTFFETLLGETLGWPLGEVGEVEDIAYAWSEEDLRAADLERGVVEGRAWQIQPLIQNQPWGIFVLEFKNPEALGTRGGMAGTLRKVLRGLVASRQKAAGLPSWKREHLLFVCTHEWQRYRFAYFRAKPDDPRCARLSAFGWAPDTPNRTVCEFNLPALEWPEAPSDAEAWVKAWAAAFDKEPLTKDFFRRFDEALDVVKSDLEEYQKLSSAEAYSQAQLLLERLIFLYFLQNRGWLNQDGHYLRAKLREYADKPEAFTYYTEFLDQLFWTLASPPDSAGRLAGIPFLNGGLFDDDEFRQPGHLRKANPPLRVRNKTFRVVFDTLLEAFNFTVTEDTPLNQEVAVDPEMLGKVFESIVLHAEAADPDATAPDKRKATGSYYTPRIVVHFICREVLYQYLLAHLSADSVQGGWGARLKELLALDVSDGIDEDKREQLKRTLAPTQAAEVLSLVKPLRCCDPAVGSGAFPVGLMHELVNLRRLLETVANGYVDPVRKHGAEWLHSTKADIVQNCLFGVDIQQQAIEICRLRLWLSLVVDYDLGLDPFTAKRGQFSRSIDRISQLPNLEVNFHRGDSLHDHISGVPVVILAGRASRHADEFQAIAKLGAKLHQAKSAETKKKLRLQILEKRLSVSQPIIDDEIQTVRTNDSALDSLFGLTVPAVEKRRRNRQELERLADAAKKIERDRNELARLRNRLYDSQFYPKLRKLEGADFDSPLNFAWRLDFPNVFGANGGGFDIVVGNPPFVTARNPAKRELWRERWPRVCYKNYLLLCPFFELSFGLLKANAQLGFIVSNAFAKRELGKLLIEDFLATVDIQKIVDCSGLMFPGHGTPTCLVFGSSRFPDPHLPVHVLGIMPGGGDLRTPPEESVLWQNIEDHHGDLEFSNAKIIVADRRRSEIDKWPWNFVAETADSRGELATRPLSSYTAEPVGAQFITGKDEAFVQPDHFFRRMAVPQSHIKRYGTGEDVRDWATHPTAWIIFPYRDDLQPLKEPLVLGIANYLRPYRETLENSVISGSTKKKETKLKWFEFRRLARAKFKSQFNIIVPQIATHAHFVVCDHRVVFKEKAQAIALRPEFDDLSNHLLAGLLNSALILDWLKKECFSKRERLSKQKQIRTTSSRVGSSKGFLSASRFLRLF
jgi:adenine-specific DNA-methyltransferase